MGKRLIILSFLLCTGIAVYVYMSRDDKSLRENLDKKGEKVPRVVVEDFVFYKNDGEKQMAKVTARMGHFFEPDLIELDGEVRGVRQTEDGPEEFGSESAAAYFEANSFSEMLENPKLRNADLTGFVEVGLKEHLLTTDYAEFLVKEEVIRSNRPVTVEGPGRRFDGENGFEYRAKEQALSLTGLVKGVVKPDEKK